MGEAASGRLTQCGQVLADRGDCDSSEGVSSDVGLVDAGPQIAKQSCVDSRTGLDRK